MELLFYSMNCQVIQHFRDKYRGIGSLQVPWSNCRKIGQRTRESEANCASYFLGACNYRDGQAEESCALKSEIAFQVYNTEDCMTKTIGLSRKVRRKLLDAKNTSFVKHWAFKDLNYSRHYRTLSQKSGLWRRSYRDAQIMLRASWERRKCKRA